MVLSALDAGAAGDFLSRSPGTWLHIKAQVCTTARIPRPRREGGRRSVPNTCRQTRHRTSDGAAEQRHQKLGRPGAPQPPATCPEPGATAGGAGRVRGPEEGAEQSETVLPGREGVYCPGMCSPKKQHIPNTSSFPNREETGKISVATDQSLPPGVPRGAARSPQPPGDHHLQGCPGLCKSWRLPAVGARLQKPQGGDPKAPQPRQPAVAPSPALQWGRTQGQTPARSTCPTVPPRTFTPVGAWLTGAVVWM